MCGLRQALACGSKRADVGARRPNDLPHGHVAGADGGETELGHTCDGVAVRTGGVLEAHRGVFHGEIGELHLLVYAEEEGSR